jgi:hypothetical protein
MKQRNVFVDRINTAAVSVFAKERSISSSVGTINTKDMSLTMTEAAESTMWILRIRPDY